MIGTNDPRAAHGDVERLGRDTSRILMNTSHSFFSNLGGLARLSDGQSRSLSPENPTGARNGGALATTGTGQKAARDLGVGWKISPSIRIEGQTTVVVGEIEGAGLIQSIWMTADGLERGAWRQAILRFYWDDQEQPSVEVPLADFFACGWNRAPGFQSLAVCVNPSGGLNCYWLMPFRSKCRITLENRASEPLVLYYQVNYSLEEVPADCAYFHAQFRRVNPLPPQTDYILLDGVRGRGHYAGTWMGWGANSNGWWGEGEIKFFLDGDTHPTICGTGTEDYFGGAWAFDESGQRIAGNTKAGYSPFSSPYSGFHVLPPDGFFRANTRFSMYRWHIPDPIRFGENLRVSIQALGWRSGGRYLPLQDDLCSVAFWYQTLPTAPFPQLPDADALEII